MGNWFKVILLLKLNELEVFSQNKKQESNHRRPSPLPLPLPIIYLNNVSGGSRRTPVVGNKDFMVI